MLPWQQLQWLKDLVGKDSPAERAIKAIIGAKAFHFILQCFPKLPKSEKTSTCIA